MLSQEAQQTIARLRAKAAANGPNSLTVEELQTFVKLQRESRGAASTASAAAPKRASKKGGASSVDVDALNAELDGL